MVDHYIFLNAASRMVGATTVPIGDVPAQEGCTAVKVDNIQDFKPNALYIDNAVVVEETVTLPTFVQAPYKAARAAAYPSLKDQFDMLWKSMDDGTLPRAEPFYSVIAGVKNQFPKDISNPNADTVVL